MIYNNILDAMGHTPMIRLNRMVSDDSAQVLVKFEGLNVGGSVKTRTAYQMIARAEKEGRIHKDTIIERKPGHRPCTDWCGPRIQNKDYYAGFCQ